ncbi:hypothetical protein ACIU1J_01340 [Azospirillum doebereinerae]|uniref:ribonuclease T2 family protein n=1 Tax=Azospirillum doebereinerae TaxID=92933 RepID=UPI00384DF618
MQRQEASPLGNIAMRTIVAALLSALVAGLFAAGPAWAQKRAEPGVFDYYVLSLSWSPAFCARAKGAPDPDQCGTDRKPGFVVHGLWPQYADGGYPATCTRDRNVPKSVVDQTMPVMPSVGLMVYQWSKHGTCSGLNATDYFAKLRAAHAKVAIPEGLKAPRRHRSGRAGGAPVPGGQPRPDAGRGGGGVLQGRRVGDSGLPGQESGLHALRQEGGGPLRQPQRGAVHHGGAASRRLDSGAPARPQVTAQPASSAMAAGISASSSRARKPSGP